MNTCKFLGAHGRQGEALHQLALCSGDRQCVLPADPEVIPQHLLTGLEVERH